MSWTRTLSGLGFPDGISREGLNEEITVYWPIPQAARRQGSATIVIALDVLIPPASETRLDILIDGQGLVSRTLAPSATRLHERLAVPAPALADGIVRLDLRYASALSANRCFDERFPGATLTLRPESGLHVTLATDVMRALPIAWELLPETLSVAVPDTRLSSAGYETALQLLGTLKSHGHSVRVQALTTSDVHRATIELTDEAAPAQIAFEPIAGENSSALDETESSLELSMILPLRDPEVIALLETGERALIEPALHTTALPIDAFGAISGTRFATDHTVWSFTIPLRALPAGMMLDRLQLSLVTPADAPDTPHLVNIFVNGVLIAGRPLRLRGQPNRVEIPVPQGLLSLQNEVRIVFERIERTPNCFGRARRVPVTLAADSRIQLRPASKSPRQFLDLVPLLTDGLLVMLPEALLERPRLSLSWLSDIIRDYAPQPWRVALQVGSIPPQAPDKPFIVIAETLPDGATHPLRFDRGAIRLTDAENRTVLEHRPDDSLGIAQMARLGDQSGVWIRTSDIPAGLDQPLQLEHGDIAFIDRTGVAFWMTSQTDRGLSIHYADTTPVRTFVSRRWPLLAGLSWLVLTALYLVGSRRERGSSK